MNRHFQNKIALIMALIIATIIITTTITYSDPAGTQITFNRTEEGASSPAESSTANGGTFTTMVLNLTQQTPRWKAYVGNVSGSFTLSDSEAATIYDWAYASTGGEVYVSRDNSPQWGSIECAQSGLISNEETYLNISSTSVDSISNTFNNTVHKEFWVGSTRIPNSTCPAIATYVNSQPQSNGELADFQEILLDDTSSIIYASLISQDTIGFDGNLYDFQLIVPEDEYSSTPTTYYFWVELS